MSMKYYLYNLKNNNLLEFENLDELIIYISYFNSEWGNEKYNRYLEDINMNFNDTRFFFWNDERIETIREYMVFDEDYRIIDIRDYAEKIFNTNYFDVIRSKNKNNIKFREEPIPRTKKRRNNKYRKPSYIGELKASEEYEKYVRLKRKLDIKSLRFYRPYKHTEKSWKRNTKFRRQWMKNLK